MAPERASHEGRPDGVGPAAGPRRFLPACLLVAAIVLASLPVIAGVTERISSDWQPQSDDAAIAWLSHDVLTSKSPLLGMPSTIDGEEETGAHHWGPLLFWVLAIPQKLFSNDPAGLQLGLLGFQLSAITGIVVFTRRRIGTLGTLTLLVALGAATWSLGRWTLSSIWNPDIALLPLAFLFVLAWSAADGDHLALPFAAFAASFVAQCNLLYTPLVASLALSAIVGFVLTSREARHLLDSAERVRRRAALVATGIVLVFCWSTAMFEQVRNRPGNVELLLRSAAGDGGERVGLVRGTYAIERTLGVTPFWSHPLEEWADHFHLILRPPLLTAVTAFGVGLLLLGGLVRNWRRDPGARALLGTAVTGIGGVAIIVVRLPVTGTLAPYRLRSLWIVGAFAWFAATVLLARLVGNRFGGGPLRARRNRVHQALATTLAAALATLAILGATGTSPAMRPPDSSDSVNTLVRSVLRNVPAPGTYLADVRSTPFNGITMGVLWGLQRNGFDIRVSTESAPGAAPYLADSHGPGDLVLPRVILVDDASKYTPAPGQQLVARSRAAPSQQAAFDAARERLCAALEADPPPLTSWGRELLARPRNDGGAAALARYADGANPCVLIDLLPKLTPSFETLAIALTPAHWAAWIEMGEIEHLNRKQDFAVYLAPPGDES